MLSAVFVQSSIANHQNIFPLKFEIFYEEIIFSKLYNWCWWGRLLSEKYPLQTEAILSTEFCYDLAKARGAAYNRGHMLSCVVIPLYTLHVIQQ